MFCTSLRSLCCYAPDSCSVHESPCRTTHSTVAAVIVLFPDGLATSATDMLAFRHSQHWRWSSFCFTTATLCDWSFESTRGTYLRCTASPQGMRHKFGPRSNEPTPGRCRLGELRAKMRGNSAVAIRSFRKI